MNKNNTSQYYSNSKRVPRVNLFKKQLLIISVAFNKPDLIKLQNLLLKKYVSDSFIYVVCDNSDDLLLSRKLRRECARNMIRYIKIPSSDRINPSLNPSISHGLGLNWIVKNVTNKYRSDYIVILDHDVFPIQQYSFINNINTQLFYGVKQKKHGQWYLWPGFFMIKKDGCKLDYANFLPAPGMDTGGSMWKSLFINQSEKTNKFALRKNVTIDKLSNKQRDVYQVIDGCWIHLVNGSNWAGIKDTRKKDVILDKLVRGDLLQWSKND